MIAKCGINISDDITHVKDHQLKRVLPTDCEPLVQLAFPINAYKNIGIWMHSGSGCC